MFRLTISLFFLSQAIFAIGQTDNMKSDSLQTKVLDEIVVTAYSYNRYIKEVPTAIGVAGPREIERFANNSLLPIVNMIPGVKMEERSPGSYRFSIRGSTLRSPFGIRNVKFYWNGLPLTDGSGNTYLNLIDFNSIGKLEVIKGPGGSLYGAGSGGVLLLSSPLSNTRRAQFSSQLGSNGLQRYQFYLQSGVGKTKFFINYTHQLSDGYRQQTAMRKDAVLIDSKTTLTNKSSLATSLFYTDLYYQTPGGLTLAQYNNDPHQARPTAGPNNLGSVVQKAAVYNKTLYGGATYHHSWNDHWETAIGVYASNTNFINPTLRNYEKRTENNAGGRVVTNYEKAKVNYSYKFTFGSEYQYFYSPLTDYVNNGGTQGILQTDDRLTSSLLLLFGQFDIEFNKNIFITAGGSGNYIGYKFNRLSTQPGVVQQRNFTPVYSPRIAVLTKISPSLFAFANISKGFSPPSLAEIRPSTGTYNNTLNPEQGISYEFGVRGNLASNLTFDITAYDFELNQTIVVQQQINNADYFINAGSTTQKGLEAQIAWTTHFYKTGQDYLKIWTNYTYNNYRFNQYIHNATDFSHHALTGVAPNIWVLGGDLYTRHFYANLTLNYVDRIPLNDATTDFANEYFLAGIRIGYKVTHNNKLNSEIFMGGDNLTNQKYSLGNDLNAAGGRYYNAAASRNYYFGIKIMPSW